MKWWWTSRIKTAWKANIIQPRASAWAQSNGFALGLKSGEKIVRAIRSFKDISLFRTKRCEPSCLPGNSGVQFRPKKFFTLFIAFPRTVFAIFPFPKAKPWARLSWPFSPGFVYKVSLLGRFRGACRVWGWGYYFTFQYLSHKQNPARLKYYSPKYVNVKRRH